MSLPNLGEINLFIGKNIINCLLRAYATFNFVLLMSQLKIKIDAYNFANSFMWCKNKLLILSLGIPRIVWI